MPTSEAALAEPSTLSHASGTLRRITVVHIAVLQAGKLSAVVAAGLVVTYVWPVKLYFDWAYPGTGPGFGPADVFLPVVSLIPGFISGVICAALFNLAAGIAGGLEVSVKQAGGASPNKRVQRTP